MYKEWSRFSLSLLQIVTNCTRNGRDFPFFCSRSSRTIPEMVALFLLSAPDCHELYREWSRFSFTLFQIVTSCTTNGRAFPFLCSRSSRTVPGMVAFFPYLCSRLSLTLPGIITFFLLPVPDCHELYQTGRRTSGVYHIQPSAAPYLLPVYCLMMNGTGHTVIQRRVDGLLNFNRCLPLCVWKL